MYQQKITLDQAIVLHEAGIITIIDNSSDNSTTLHSVWKNNFTQLQTRAPHISPERIPSYYNAKYLIEINEGLVDQQTQTYSWRYVHGIENTVIASKVVDDIEYVYVLVNAGYPDLVKIGMTIHDVNRRVTSINATGTVHEWVAKFALPVKKGCALKVEQSVHKAFTHRRVSSDLGNQREFFQVDVLTAFDKVRELGAMFQIGNPVIY